MFHFIDSLVPFCRYVALYPNFVRFRLLGLLGGPRLLSFLRFVFSLWALFVYIGLEWACRVSLELVARPIPYVLLACRSRGLCRRTPINLVEPVAFVSQLDSSTFVTALFTDMGLGAYHVRDLTSCLLML